MRAIRTRLVAALSVVLLAHLAGCGDRSNVQVKGTLLKDGKPYQLAQDEQVQVTFAGEDFRGAAFSASARVQPDSTFVMQGAANRGIPPGTYKIALSAEIYGPKNEGDRFNGAFAENKTPLSYTVTKDGVQEIVVDVGKKTVSKK
jgi:hypothetical protein